MSEFVVYDLEYTSWEGAWQRDWSGPGEHREIVQIGAVRLSADWRERASLQMLVRPRVNPRLSRYFTDLTGISQDRLDAEGRPVAEALAALVDFAAPDCRLVANGTDADVIAETCGLNGLANPLLGRCGDVRPVLEEAAGGVKVLSADLPQVFGLAPSGRGHDALADARNVAAALGRLAARGLWSPPPAV